MRFLALLCGRMANQSSAAVDTNNRAALPQRDRSTSIGGMGPSLMDVDNNDTFGVLPTSETILTTAIGKGAGISDDIVDVCYVNGVNVKEDSKMRSKRGGYGPRMLLLSLMSLTGDEPE